VIRKIISGGQTGADRAALDFAVKHNIPHGGWIPKGRKTEAGMLPTKYNLQEMPTPEYTKCTEKNVLNADGTLILSHGPLTGGSALTVSIATRNCKPHLHIDFEQGPLSEAAQRIRQWLQNNDIKVLNVAGPRASKDAAIYQDVIALLEMTFSQGEAEG